MGTPPNRRMEGRGGAFDDLAELGSGRGKRGKETRQEARPQRSTGKRELPWFPSVESQQTETRVEATERVFPAKEDMEVLSVGCGCKFARDLGGDRTLTKPWFLGAWYVW